MVLADVRKGVNSYYKLQILVDDKGGDCSVFRSWGRVGTDIGGTKIERFGRSVEAAQQAFNALFQEKTGGNDFLIKPYTKHPGAFFPLDMQYSDVAANAASLVAPGSRTSLPKAVVDLVSLLFDKTLLSQTMVEMDLDLSKMPLGQLSRHHLERAMGVLTSLQDLLQQQKKVKPAKLLAVSNQFYSMIPHDCGSAQPPLIDNDKLLVEKLHMLEDLLNMEVAARVLNAASGAANAESDPVDFFYAQLNTDLQVLDRSSAEFLLVQEYVANTHAGTHMQYALEIDEVFVSGRSSGHATRTLRDGALFLEPQSPVCCNCFHPVPAAPSSPGLHLPAPHPGSMHRVLPYASTHWNVIRTALAGGEPPWRRGQI